MGNNEVPDFHEDYYPKKFVHYFLWDPQMLFIGLTNVRHFTGKGHYPVMNPV